MNHLDVHNPQYQFSLAKVRDKCDNGLCIIHVHQNNLTVDEEFSKA